MTRGRLELLAGGAVLVATVLFTLLAGAPGAAKWGQDTGIEGVATGVRGLVVGSSAEGHAVAAWSGASPDAAAVFVAVRAPGRRFVPPVALSRPGVLGAPAMAVGLRGAAIVAWARRDRSDRAPVVEAAVRPPGGAFQPPRAIRSARAETLTAIVTPDGLQGVGWVERAGRRRRLVLSRADAAGVLAAPGEIAAAPDLRSYGLAANEEGVWSLVSAGGSLRAVLTGPDGKTSATALGESEDGGAVLAGGVRGDIVAVWSADGNVRMAREAPGRPWSEPLTLGAGRAPRATVDWEGNATIAWLGPAGVEVIGSSRDGALLPRTPERPVGDCADPGFALTGDLQGSAHLLASCPELTAVSRAQPGEAWGAPARLLAGRSAASGIAATSAGAAFAAWGQGGALRTAFRDLGGEAARSTLVP